MTTTDLIHINAGCRLAVVSTDTRDGAPYQVVIRCGNGYGASIVQGPYTYGGPQGLYELGVIRFEGEGPEWDLTYDTPITDDVIGWLTEDDVARTVEAIAALPPGERQATDR